MIALHASVRRSISRRARRDTARDTYGTARMGADDDRTLRVVSVRVGRDAYHPRCWYMILLHHDGAADVPYVETDRASVFDHCACCRKRLSPGEVA